jgi:hypothetical protein
MHFNASPIYNLSSTFYLILLNTIKEATDVLPKHVIEVPKGFFPSHLPFPQELQFYLIKRKNET